MDFLRIIGLRKFSFRSLLWFIASFVLYGVSACSDTPKVIEFTQNAQKVERYEKFEVSFVIDVQVKNPFDPEKIAFDGIFTAPSGKHFTVPAFFAGSSSWRVRFAPAEIGRYNFFLTGKVGKKIMKSTNGSFEVVESADDGFIRVSEKAPIYFEFDSKQPYFPIGENVSWSNRYEYYFTKLSKCGANFARIWMCPWNLGLEKRFEPGRYDLENARRLDSILAMAKEHRIHVMLCFDYHGSFMEFEGRPIDQKWHENPYNAQNGGPCKSAASFLMNELAKSIYKKRLRYIVGRWGYSTQVFAWELFNEADLIDHDKAYLIQWHTEMSEYLKRIDPFGHLVTTSFSGKGYREIWALESIDFTQTHLYEAKDFALSLPRRCQTAIKKHNKPHLIGEFGVSTLSGERTIKIDPSGIGFHNGLWASALSGCAGTAMSWWWDTYIDKRGLYPHLQAIAQFLTGVPWTEAQFRPISVKSILSPKGEKLYSLRVIGLQSEGLILLWAQNKERIWSKGNHLPSHLEEAEITLESVYDGEYFVEWWDTYSGSILDKKVITTREGELKLSGPTVSTDIACKIYGN